MKDRYNKKTINKIVNEQGTIYSQPLKIFSQNWKHTFKSLNNNKAPGTDGLPIEIYKRFQHKFVPVLLDLFRDYENVNKMQLSARRGIISLLEKPSKDQLYIPNWRPLTLLNYDNKIYAKILATRLNIVLPKLIDKMQTGFMKGCSIATNTMRLISTINYCKEEEIDTALLSFDFDKAFDSIEWASIYKNIGLQFLANGLSLHFSVKSIALFMKST